MADRPSWRDLDRKRDQSRHRQEERPRGRAPRVESATAAYKRKLDAFFDEGKIPEHLKDKLPAGEAGDAGPSGRQKLIREIRKATGKDLEKAIDQLRAEYGLPDDMEILLRVLEHSKDPVLFEALQKIEAFVETGKQVPKKKLLVQRLKGLEFSSFDPRVQRKAVALASRLS